MGLNGVSPRLGGKVIVAAFWGVLLSVFGLSAPISGARAAADPLQPVEISLATDGAEFISGQSTTLTVTLVNPNATGMPTTSFDVSVTPAVLSRIVGAPGGTCLSTGSIPAVGTIRMGVSIPANGTCTITYRFNAVTAGTTSFTSTPFTPSGFPMTVGATSPAITVKPNVTSVSPTSGPNSGGNSVTINGAGFSTTLSENTVRFGTVDALVTAATATRLTVTAPAGAGSVSVAVTTNSQAATATPTYSYYPPLEAELALPQVDARQGEPVKVRPVTASGGRIPYVFTLENSPPLPPGLSFNSEDGMLYGTPSAAASAQSYTVRVTESGTSPASASRTFVLTVARPPNEISFTSTPPVGARAGGATYTPAATATSALPVTFSIAPASSAVCTISNGVVSFTGAGTCTIRADQSGDSEWDPAATVEQDVTVAAAYSAATISLATGSSAIKSGDETAVTVTVGNPNSDAMPQASILLSVAPNVLQRVIGAPGGTCASSGSIPDAGKINMTVQSVPANSSCTIVYRFTGGTAGTTQFTSSAFTPSGWPQTAAASSATVSVAPSVTGIAPSNGPETGGTSVVIRGAGFDTTLANNSVRFGTQDATVTAATATALTVTAPAGTGTASVNVSTNAQAAASAPSFTYIGAPVAANLSDVAVAYGSTGTAIDLSSSVTGQATGLALATAPSHGSVTFAGTVATYTPNAGYYGADSFTYTATGIGGTSAPATVTVAVATPAAPVAAEVSDVAVAYDSPGTPIDLSNAVTGVSSSLALGRAPDHGTVTFSGAVATYTPTPGHYGADSFTYIATGPGGSSAPAAVTLTVATPAAPVATDLSDVSVDYGTQGTTIDLGGAVTGVSTTLALEIAPSHGSVTFSGAVATYVPEPGYFGPDSFGYSATGPGGTSAAATVRLVVAPPPPPVVEESAETVPAATETNAGSTVTIDLASLATGIYDRIEVVSPPAHGTVRIEGNPPPAASGRRALAAAGIRAVYQPNPGYVGPDSFAWVAVGPGGTSRPATVTINVTGNVPVLQPRKAATGDGETVSIELTEGAPEGPFTAAEILSTTPANAATATITASGSGADRRYRLDVTPAARFGGTVVVTYTLSNQFGTSAPATVTVTVTARPDPTQDPNIRALSDAQAESARRFAQAQTGNFMRRNEQLHGGGGAGAAMGFSLSARDGSPGAYRRASTPAEDALAITERMRGAAIEDDAAALPAGGQPGAGGGEARGPRRIGEFAIWSGGTIEVSTLDRTTGRAKISASTGGLSAGIDVKLAPGFVVGLGGGYGHETSRIGGGAAEARADSGVAALYGSYTISDRAFADFVFGYGSLDYRLRRTVTETGAIARGDRNGDMLLAGFSAGIDRRGGPVRWSLYGRGEYLAATLDAYAESGAGRYDLRFAERDLKSLSGVLGGRAEFTQKTGFGTVTPRLRVEWRHEFADSDAQWLDYADIPGAPLYRIDSMGWKRDRVELGFGSALDLGSRWALDVELGVAAGQGERTGRLNARVSKTF